MQMDPRTLWCDLETRSGLGINRGSYVYAQNSALLLFLYAFGDDGPEQVWDAASNQPMPADLESYLADRSIPLAFHNTEFDRVQLHAWLGAGGRFPLPLERFFCTMTAARVAGLPGALDDLCRVLGVPEGYAKKDGNALIRLFCIPDAEGRYVQPHERPVEWARFIDYGLHDVSAMRYVTRLIPDVYSADEREFMRYTSLMNDRGLPIDTALCHAAVGQADALKRRATHRANVALAKDGHAGAEPFNLSSQKAFVEMFAQYGVAIPDAKAATLRTLLETDKVDPLPPALVTLLRERLASNKAAVTKYSAMLAGCNHDGRARGLITHYGASRTGRDSGRRIQAQNFARAKIVGEVPGWSMETAVRLVKADALDVYTDQPMQILADAARGAICAPPGRKFCDADLSSIEGRVLPWLAGEEWMLDFYRGLDAGTIKYDAYKLAYSICFGVDPAAVTKAQRQYGKPIELAFGFGGGVGALVTFCALYSIDPEEMSAVAWQNCDRTRMAEAEDSFDWFEGKGLTYGFPRAVWAGLQYIVKTWREKRAQTVKLWRQCGDAFAAAALNPGRWAPMATATWVINNQGTNYVRLPSGRFLLYHQVKIDGDAKRPEISYKGVHPTSKKWWTIHTHPGKLAENLTQAVARDVLFYNIPGVEAEGYPVVMRVHDQLLAETPDDPRWSGEQLARLISRPHAWAPGLPLNAAGEDCYRFS